MKGASGGGFTQVLNNSDNLGRSRVQDLTLMSLQKQHQMTLIASVSGIRGTIGGSAHDNLTPVDCVAFASAYGAFIQSQAQGKPKVAIGRDARPSGDMVQSLVSQTLVAMGIDVLDLGLSTTPTVEMVVPWEHCDGGIIITASHNPVQWNALKLLNARGEFLSAEEGEALLTSVKQGAFEYAQVENLGSVTVVNDAIERHIQAILDLPMVDVDAIRKANFSVAVDAVNSTGGISIPPLLRALGVARVEALYCEPNGQFPHNPEPLRKHLDDICSLVPAKGCDLGVVVDPDVDRLVMVSENGELFGEEYTLVAVSDYILSQQAGHCVSNMSSSRALADVASQRQSTHSFSAVGEVHVVKEMKAQDAIIGGEGNGGVIYPELHYGRDALVGVALFLSHLAQKGGKASELRASYPNYYMAKEKAQLTPDLDVDGILSSVRDSYADRNPSTVDGVKIEFDSHWVHLRKSNTEPIIRIYTEAPSQEQADALAAEFVQKIEAHRG